MADNEVNGWISSIKSMLGSVNQHRIEVSSISYAPEQLRKSRGEAYIPKVVSIGPLHTGTRRELLYMEEIKWRCMLSLLYRTPEPEESLEKCSKAILALDKAVRATYVNDIKLKSYDLAKIMLLDGCFLLELLFSNSEGLDGARKSNSHIPKAEVGNMEQVLSDLKLLENQIPIFILVVLFRNLFPDLIPFFREKFQNIFPSQTTSGDFIGIRKILNGLALCFFGFSSDSSPVDSPNCAHFLELMHWFITREKEGIAEENNHHSSIAVDGNVNLNSSSTSTIPKLKCCAASLEDTGVTVEPLREEGGSMPIRVEDRKQHVITFDADIKFSDSKGKRKLEIQPLHINETTEVLWWNFIAWEQNRITHEKFLGKDDILTPCKFSQYALLFKDLVCCEQDIQLLRDREVLRVDDGKRSNEDLMTLFRIQIDASADRRFGQLINDINAYLGDRGHRRAFRHCCRSIATNTITSTKGTCRDWYAILKRDHTPTVWKKIGVFAAILLLGLTIAQTILAAISL